MKIFPEVQILLCARLKDIAAGERQRQARKFATTSCHGQPASFASRSYHSVHDSIVVVSVVGVRPCWEERDLPCRPRANNTSTDRKRFSSFFSNG